MRSPLGWRMVSHARGIQLNPLVENVSRYVIHRSCKTAGCPSELLYVLARSCYDQDLVLATIFLKPLTQSCRQVYAVVCLESLYS